MAWPPKICEQPRREPSARCMPCFAKMPLPLLLSHILEAVRLLRIKGDLSARPRELWREEDIVSWLVRRGSAERAVLRWRKVVFHLLRARLPSSPKNIQAGRSDSSICRSLKLEKARQNNVRAH